MHKECSLTQPVNSHAHWAATIRRTGDAISNVCMYLAGIALLVIVAINGINVAGRYFFAAPILWAEESMLYLMIFVVFVGGITVSWRGIHMKLDVFLYRMRRHLRRIVVLFCAVLGVTVLLVISFASIEIVSMLYAFDQRSDALEVPMWIPQSFVPLGLTSFAIMIVLRLLAFGLDARPSDHDDESYPDLAAAEAQAAAGTGTAHTKAQEGNP
ncbi:TRAP transporter small permease [Pseudochelatococcus sp. B33]